MNRNQGILPYYENIEFNVSTGSTNYDVDSQQSTFLSLFGLTNAAKEYASRVSIRTNNTITVKLNSTSDYSITIASTDSPFVIEGVEIRNIYISNSSGSTAAVKLFLQETPY